MPSLLPVQPQNILLTHLSPPGDIKIVDFGLARRLGGAGELREIIGTPEYVGKTPPPAAGSRSVSGFLMLVFVSSAPEVLNYEPITTATDLW